MSQGFHPMAGRRRQGHSKAVVYPGVSPLKKTLFLAAAAWCGSAVVAQAAIIPVLDTVTPVGPNYEYSYSGTLAGDQGMVAGSKLIIFDFAGYVAGSISAGIYAADLMATVENLSALAPPAGWVDDPGIPNLVFTWKGAPFNASGGPFADVSFAGLTARSTISQVTVGAFSAMAVINNGAATGLVATNDGYVGVPAVPEPSAWAMLIVGFGLIGAGLRLRRRGPGAVLPAA